ncbi:MAG: hypothetical protein JW748_04945 [Anaerolineales bacterium]|nr:hypothetical protein [Anaerolineales bacterium]
MEIIILVILYLILCNRGKAGFVTLRISFGAGGRRSQDISAQELPVPPELKHLVGALADLGFSRLGEVQVKIPGGQTALSRIYVSADKRIFAELTESRIVLFTSVFPDDTVVETGFPVGENFNTKVFRSHTVTTGIEQAHQHQLREIKAYRRPHGIPRKIETMEDYRAWEAMYRAKHVSRKMRRHTWLGFLQTAALGVGIAALLAAFVYWLGSEKTTIEPMLFIALVLIAAVTPVAIAAFFLPYIGDWGSRRGRQ